MLAYLFFYWESSQGELQYKLLDVKLAKEKWNKFMIYIVPAEDKFLKIGV